MLARTFILVTLGAFASAQTLEGFPETLTCQQSGGGTADISKAEMKAAIVGPKGNKEDDSAANVASGKCSSLSGIPLFTVGAAGKGNIGFAYDKSKDTYHFCFGQGAVDEKIGYPSQCTAKGATKRLRFARGFTA